MQMPARKSTTNQILRNLPSVDELLRSDTGRTISAATGDRHASAASRTVISALRKQIATRDNAAKSDLVNLGLQMLTDAWGAEIRSGVRHVINATGVVIHTN